MKKAIPANEQTVALLIGMLQWQEEKIHELNIETAALSILLQKLELLPEFRTQFRAAVRLARTQHPAPAKNKIEKLVRQQTAEVEALLAIKKQKPN